MMISQKMVDRLNLQVTNEFYSSYLYQSMAYALEAMSFKGFAAWYHAQAQEERTHAMRIAGYLLDQGGKVKLGAIDQPQTEFKSVQEIVEMALEHEKKVTAQVAEIAGLADELKDYATRKFIDWKVGEQVEEVATASDILEMVKRCTTEGQLMMVQNYLKRPSEGGASE